MPRLAPQDKACIDQGNIQQSLACLPIFLAGCQTLLVVAGPTYCSRLWCVMELFTFARSERLLYYCYLNPMLSTRARLSNRSHAPVNLSIYSQSLFVQWAATKSVSKSISSRTRTMTKRRHGGC